MAKRSKIKVWYVFEYLNHDPMMFAFAPKQSWVEDCTDKAHAKQRVRELNATIGSTTRYGFNFRWDFKSDIL